MDAVWLGFDVDETLGNFQYLFPIFEFLMLRDGTYEPGQRTFQALTQMIAQNEITPANQIGLFRPGLYNFFTEKLKPLRDAGILKGMVMYSNNSEYNILRFCAIVIDRWLESPKSFCNLIHRTHYIRQNTSGEVNTLEKKWSILTKAFLDGKCPPPVLGQTFFYDDLNTHRDLMDKLGSKYIQVVPYFGPASKGNLLTSLRSCLLTTGLLKQVVKRPNGSITGSDFVFDADYIMRLYGVYKNESTAGYIKADLQVLFTLTGETPEQLANVTWKDYQKALQELFKIEDASIEKHKRPNTRSTAVNMKQWYDPLVTPPVEHERANEMIERRMRELQRSSGNQTRSANRARSSSAGLTRSNTPKKGPGRSFANLATNYNNTPKPKSMENELKEAFGLGGGRRLTKRRLRKNASRKKKTSSRK